jgi:hypothetical protein
VRLRLGRGTRGTPADEDLRADVEAAYSSAGDADHVTTLPPRVVYVPVQGTEITYRLKPSPDEATPQDRLAGLMERALTITVSYRVGRRTVRASRTQGFAVQLNAERVIRRVPANLGNILGLAPKNMR